SVSYRINEPVSNDSLVWVVDLIDSQNREWKVDLIKAAFSEAVSPKILPIPLAQEVHDNVLVWRGESSREFTVRSAYKLLHKERFLSITNTLQNSIISFYKRLWRLHLPSKIKILMWRTTWVNAWKSTVVKGIDERCPSVVPYVKFNFDAAFNQSLNISSLGIVVRNHRDEIIMLKTVMHKKLASPFDTEGLVCLQALLLGGIPHSVVDAMKRRCPREPD
ncbi:hypothetical protein Goarm_010200, partial [Gossypium armourianum]|nr:hypothetical protein [Gossypium armourianum]